MAGRWVMRRRGLIAYAPASLFAVAATFALSNGCSSSSGAASGPIAEGGAEGGDADVVADAAADAPTQDVRTDSAPQPDSGPDPFAGCSPHPANAAHAPPGWKVWADYDRCCGFMIPPTATDLPAPLAWRACDSASPISTGCRQLVVTWPTYYGDAISPWIVGWVHNGTVTFQISEMMLYGTAVSAMRMIADADGPVHQAIFEAGSQACTLGSSQLQDGRYVYQLSKQNSDPPVAIAGSTNDLVPRVFFDINDNFQHNYWAGKPGLLEARYDGITGGYLLHDWNNATQTTHIIGGQTTRPTFQGDALFYGEGKLSSWTAMAGVKELVALNDYPTTEVANIGSDGVDLVWLEADGQPDGGIHASAKIMTSPFTTDPAQLVPRRLRSESPAIFGGIPHYIVGCGYGAFMTYYAGTYYVRIVRIADGVSWLLPTNPTGWFWGEPVALTCTELFLRGGTTNEGSLVRIRLDSLGQSIPPD